MAEKIKKAALTENLEFKISIKNNDKHQDFVGTYKDDRIIVAGVFDGHGKDDCHALYPKTAAESLFALARSGRTDYSKWSKEIDAACTRAMVDAYGLTEGEDGVLRKHGSIFHGGTTLSAIIIDRCRQIVTWMNAGDSEICFFGESEENEKVEVLSTCHSQDWSESW